MNKPKTGLFDYDSLIYACVYYIASPNPREVVNPIYHKSENIRNWFNEGRSREWMENEILNLSINRLEQMGLNVFIAIEKAGFKLGEIEYHITYCKDAYRKKLTQGYKKSRKPNKWVSQVRRWLIKANWAIYNDEFESDDTIADRSRELGVDNCIVISPDKDLNQLGGYIFNYGKYYLFNDFDKPVLDEYGNHLKDYKGFNTHQRKEGSEPLLIGKVNVYPQEIIDYNKFWTKDEAKRCLFEQMIIGDKSDEIPGCKGFGATKVDGILGDNTDEYEKNVLHAYLLSEIKQLKTKLNKENAEYKKIKGDVFVEMVLDGFELDLDLLKMKAQKEYDLNYQLLSLGIKDRIRID